MYENGNARGAVGSAYTLGMIYRVRITLGSSNDATYEIQGGTEYNKIGSDTWDDITPGTSSSATTPLHAGIVMYNDTVYFSDARIY